MAEEETNENNVKYLPELMAEKDSIDPTFVHAVRLISNEIERIKNPPPEKDKPDVQEKDMINIFGDKLPKVTCTIKVPVNEFPHINFVGRLIGPGGSTLKGIQDITSTRIGILGRGSMRDKKKAEELAAGGEAKYQHLNLPLHVKVTAVGSVDQAYVNIGRACSEIMKLLQVEDDEYMDPSMGGMRGMGMSQRGIGGRGMMRGRGGNRGAQSGRGGSGRGRGGPRGAGRGTGSARGNASSRGRGGAGGGRGGFAAKPPPPIVQDPYAAQADEYGYDYGEQAYEGYVEYADASYEGAYSDAYAADAYAADGSFASDGGFASDAYAYGDGGYEGYGNGADVGGTQQYGGSGQYGGGGGGGNKPFRGKIGRGRGRGLSKPY